MLRCFLVPDEKVIARVGFKRAAGCLLSKSCFLCEKMAANANPITFTRVCKPCASAYEASFLISKSKAKEAFLLGEKDIKVLPSAAFESETVAGKDCIGSLLLMSDVKEAAFAKYGGADGLAAEFVRRTRTAVERYTKSQSTAKPQKKRPKIEKLSTRPTENLQQLAFYNSSLPIGTAFVERANGFLTDGKLQLKMDHSVTCKVCDRMGLCSDVIMHERLEHGLDMILRGVEPQPRQEPAGLSTPEEVPGVTDELTRLLANATIVYTRAIEEEQTDAFDCHHVSTSCLISLNSLRTALGDQRDKITVCVDEYRGYNECEWGNFNLCYQLSSGGVPFKLLELGIGENCEDKMEAATHRFEDLIQALGLTQTDPAQLLVTLVSRAMTVDDICEMLSEVTVYRPPPREEMPVVYAAIDILKTE